MGDEIERDHMTELANKALASTSQSGKEKKTKRRDEEKDEDESDNEEAESRKGLRSEHQVERAPNKSSATRTAEAAAVAPNLPSLSFKIKILVIQNIGIVSGFSFMLLMAIHSESITF